MQHNGAFYKSLVQAGGVLPDDAIAQGALLRIIKRKGSDTGEHWHVHPDDWHRYIRAHYLKLQALCKREPS